MSFMVVERFRDQDVKAVYRRFREEGRTMPDGLSYEESWEEVDLHRCFQLVECDDVALLQRWVANWQDLVESEFVPVLDGGGTAETIEPLLARLRGPYVTSSKSLWPWMSTPSSVTSAR